LPEVEQKKQNLPDEQWTDMVKQMIRRPNNNDEAEAKTFAKKVLV